MYPRTVRVRSTSGTVNEYVRIVEAYREDGKVKQRVVADLGRKDLLIEVLPKLRKLLTGEELAKLGKDLDQEIFATEVGDDTLLDLTVFTVGLNDADVFVDSTAGGADS